jgi:hypothetical protein
MKLLTAFDISYCSLSGICQFLSIAFGPRVEEDTFSDACTPRWRGKMIFGLDVENIKRDLRPD